MRPTAPDELANDSEVPTIKGAGGKFGGCALKAVGLIAGDLLHVLESVLRLE